MTSWNDFIKSKTKKEIKKVGNKVYIKKVKASASNTSNNKDNIANKEE